ncbi:MAG: transglycosylase SLT domain-containing protein [Pseudobdellovibrionaceae bacterium]
MISKSLTIFLTIQIIQISLAEKTFALGMKLSESTSQSQPYQMVSNYNQQTSHTLEPSANSEPVSDNQEPASAPLSGRKLPASLANNIVPLWENQRPEGRRWTEYVITQMDSKAPELLDAEPADSSFFCPRFKNFSDGEKKYFWAYFLSAMVKFESNFNPESKYQEGFKDSSGSLVVSRGLLQLSYESAKAYGCPVRRATDLHDPELNLQCGLKILGRWVGRDQRIAGKVNGAWKGGSRYWAVLRSGKKSYQNIAQLVAQYKSCQ